MDSTTPDSPTPANPPRATFRPDDQGLNVYRMLTSLVVPRPIAWVSSVDEDGSGNLAPHSFFTVVSSEPPVVMFTSLGHKDTLRNIKATGEFVVNVVTKDLMEVCNLTSADLEPSVDEADYFGVRMEDSEVVRPPRVAASPASLECSLHSTTEVGNGVIILGEVLAMTVREDLLKDGLADVTLLDPVSRLGGIQWSGLGPLTDLARPRLEDVLPAVSRQR